MTSIGVYHSSAKFRYDVGRQPQEGQIGYIQIHSCFLQGLEDLQNWSHIWVIFEFHQIQNYKLKVLPPLNTSQKKGVFATRSPHRPSRLGLSLIEINKIKNNKIYLNKNDLLNQTPILDIKPYIWEHDSPDPIKKLILLQNSDFLNDVSYKAITTGWKTNLEPTFKITTKPLYEKQIQWIQKNLTDLLLHESVVRQLSQDPLDRARKRIQPKDPDWVFSYRTWRVHYSVQKDTVVLNYIYSGYSSEDLKNYKHDPYKDKKDHIHYQLVFGDPW